MAALGRFAGPGGREARLASHGYKAQMGHDWAEGPQPDALYTSVPGGYGSEGAFEAKARRLNSPFTVFVSSNLRASLFGALAAMGLSAALNHIRRCRRS